MNQWTIRDPEFVSDFFDPDRQTSPWSGHRQFAFDLVGFLRPSRIVELGTHYGCSFFAFCQAVRDHGLDCEIVAVDTWEGDEHAGFYSGVYEKVANWCVEEFPDLRTRLVRMPFSEAVGLFQTQEIDLLHIDGLHTYDAVSRDYEEWKSRVSDDGTFLFHDVDPRSGYGSADFWEDLKDALPSFTFRHNFGLGVLTRNRGLAEVLCTDYFRLAANFYEANAERNLLRLQVNDLSEFCDAKALSIESMSELIDDRDSVIASMSELIDDRDSAIASMTELIDDRDSAIASMTELIDDRDALVADQQGLIQRIQQSSNQTSPSSVDGR